jgi:hypothetical protein
MTKTTADLLQEAQQYATYWNVALYGDLPEGLNLETMSHWPPDLIQDLSIRIGVFEDFKIHYLFPNTDTEERKALFKLARNRFALQLSHKFDLPNLDENRRDFEDSVQGVRAWDLDQLTPLQNQILEHHYFIDPWSDPDV